MQLDQDSNHSLYQIKAYELGVIIISMKKGSEPSERCLTPFYNSLIIGAETLISDWSPQSLAEVTEASLLTIIRLKPEVVILGTGIKFKVPEKWIIETFHRQKIGFEFMDTGAACRTFVALSAEGRNVVAGLLIE